MFSKEDTSIFLSIVLHTQKERIALTLQAPEEMNALTLPYASLLSLYMYLSSIHMKAWLPVVLWVIDFKPVRVDWIRGLWS